MHVHWPSTENGYDWEPVIPGQPAVLEGGDSETDFIFLKDGSLVAVSRNEMGDETGWDMKIFRADSDDLGNWGRPRLFDLPSNFPDRFPRGNGA